MSTSRHPSYRPNVPAADLIDSTEAARILAGTDHTTAEGWRRLDQLRAIGRLKPATADRVRWNRLEVEYHARPWEYDDPIRAARGAIYAVAIGGILLGIVAFNVWYWIVR